MSEAGSALASGTEWSPKADFGISITDEHTHTHTHTCENPLAKCLYDRLASLERAVTQPK